jgi:DNA replication and repair protein RecF
VSFRLTALTAHDFRNLAPLDWRPDPGRHLLLGPNGAGKTSLLEAVYVLATTKSFRTPRLADCVRHPAGEAAAEGFRLAGEVEGPARTRLAVAWDRDGLARSVNGATVSLSEHLSVLPVVAWSSAEVEILTGAPAQRRRFLDRGAVSRRPGLLPTLTRYRRALGQKRELLTRGGPPPADQLAPWNDLLAQAGAELAAARASYTEKLAGVLTGTLAAAGLPFPEVVLRYRPSPPESVEGTEALRRAFERARAEEIDRRQPRIGPHRDDLDVLWGGRPVKEVASAGERKSLSLLLAAAQGQVLASSGRTPVLLLDDLDAELAPETLERVWPVMGDGDGGVTQLLATSNRETVWRDLSLDHRWRVFDGVLSPS